MNLRRTAISLCAAAATALTLVTPAQALVVANPVTDFANAEDFQIHPIGSYDTGQFDESAAEIVEYYAEKKLILTVNANSGAIDLISIEDPTAPTKVGSISAGTGTSINSVQVRADGLAVAAVQPENKTDEGSMLFFNAASGEELGSVALGGALPDMVGITADGKYAFTANEGEPADDYSVDPEGSVSLVALPEEGDLRAPTAADVRVADFRAFNAEGALPDGVRVFGPSDVEGTPAQNLEPEYIAESDGKLYATLQENNAIAVIDIATATVERIFPLGTVDHAVTPLDASDRDSGIEITNHPVKGFHQPDTVVATGNYLVMANEGDARDWDAYSEEARVKDLGDPDEGLPGLCEGYQGLTAEEIDTLQSDEAIGRLNITLADGLNADGTCYEQLYSFGSRSFSIYSTDGQEVFNSGDDFEQITARLHQEGKLVFNSSHDEAWFDSRSDNKGPEPEGVTLGTVGDREYAFIGLERVSGVIVYDITDPANATYAGYVSNRDYSVSAIDEESEELVTNWADAGDLGPEGLKFIPAAHSPNGKDLLVVGNEVSGTTTIFEIASGQQQEEEVESTGSSAEAFGIGALLAIIAAIALNLPMLKSLVEKLLP